MVAPILGCCDFIDNWDITLQFSLGYPRIQSSERVLKYGTPHNNFQIECFNMPGLNLTLIEDFDLSEFENEFFARKHLGFDSITSYYFLAEFDIVFAFAVYDSNGRTFDIDDFVPVLHYDKFLSHCYTYKEIIYPFKLESPVYGDPYTRLDSLGKKDIQKNFLEFSPSVYSLLCSKIQSFYDSYSSFSFVYDQSPYESSESSPITPHYGMYNIRDVQGTVFSKFGFIVGGQRNRFPNIRIKYNFEIS
ncbi:hypothetical protein, partial [Campylobacter fetus]|uniref:hypothetical protein n=1 Tax=Campylobacter fetus TaxID=196 RepID=UPI000828E0B0